MIRRCALQQFPGRADCEGNKCGRACNAHAAAKFHLASIVSTCSSFVFYQQIFEGKENGERVKAREKREGLQRPAASKAEREKKAKMPLLPSGRDCRAGSC